MPIKWEREESYVREKYMDMYYEYRKNTSDQQPGPEVLHALKKNVHDILTYLNSINKKTCKK